MNGLLHGIQVRISQACLETLSFENRLSLSKGSVSTMVLLGNDSNYTSNAFIPRLPWYRADTATVKYFQDNSAENSIGNSIAIVDLPHSLLDMFHDVKQASRTNQYTLMRQLSSKVMFEAERTALGDYVRKHFAIEPAKSLVGGWMVANRPNMPTLTFDAGPRYIGLHVDSFYGGNTEQRKQSPNRICVNLGASYRYLVFVNLPLHKCAEMLFSESSQQSDIVQGAGSELGNRFLHTFPNYPISRIRIEPGEAYIAPTENIIHDGSTLGTSNIDVHITFLGGFRTTALL